MGRKVVVGLAVVVALAALVGGGLVWSLGATRVSTDDAYVEGTIAPVSAKVGGHVVERLVGDHQAVRRGQLLLRIDPRDYLARREQARAAVAVAEAALRAARSEVPLARDATRAEIEERRAALDAARTAVRAGASAVEEARARREARLAAAAAMRADLAAAESHHRKAAREVERMRRLARDDYVSRREHDEAEAAFEATAAAVEAARRRLAQTEREVQQMEAELASRRIAVEQATERAAEARAALARAESQVHQVAVKTAEIARAEARLREAQADLRMAELAVEHTEVRAPLDGVVAKRAVEVGQVVQPGQPLLAVVPLHEVWVVANFKETQLARVRPGLRAEVTVDGYPGRVFPGVVDSISAGTGARFSLLPPENATGNWVKVVQRVPVKILLDDRPPDNPHPLRAGMSAHVTIRLR